MSEFKTNDGKIRNISESEYAERVEKFNLLLKSKEMQIKDFKSKTTSDPQDNLKLFLDSTD